MVGPRRQRTAQTQTGRSTRSMASSVRSVAVWSWRCESPGMNARSESEHGFARLLAGEIEGGVTAQRRFFGDPTGDHRRSVAAQTSEVEGFDALEFVIRDCFRRGDEEILHKALMAAGEFSVLGLGHPPHALFPGVVLHLGVVLADQGAVPAVGDGAVEVGWKIDSLDPFDRRLPEGGRGPTMILRDSRAGFAGPGYHR